MDKQPRFLGRQIYLSWSQILLGVVVSALGLVLTIWPDIASNALLNGIGTILILAGLIRSLRYFRGETSVVVLANDLAIGLISIMAGILIISLKALLFSLIPVLLGIVVLVGGVIKLQSTLDMKRMHIRRWYLELACTIISIVLGILILFNPFSTAMLLMRVIGVALLLEGVVDLISKHAYEKVRGDYLHSRR